MRQWTKKYWIAHCALLAMELRVVTTPQTMRDALTLPCSPDCTWVFSKRAPRGEGGTHTSTCCMAADCSEMRGRETREGPGSIRELVFREIESIILSVLFNNYYYYRPRSVWRGARAPRLLLHTPLHAFIMLLLRSSTCMLSS